MNLKFEEKCVMVKKIIKGLMRKRFKKIFNVKDGEC
jgi:hypothetical protein